MVLYILAKLLTYGISKSAPNQLNVAPQGITNMSNQVLVISHCLLLLLSVCY